MTRRRLLDFTTNDAPPPDDVSPNILITVLILAIAVILSASLYLLLRFLRRHRTSSTAPQPTPQPPSRRKVTPSTNDPLIDTLPLFTFETLSSTGDCAVCLSKFEPQDILRLLPICCHAFHADCIDTWLNSNYSCPLCRSPVFIPESELLAKLDNPNPTRISSSDGSRSFRVEIGNISQRNSGEVNPVRRSYSLGGNFDYVVDEDAVSEVHSGSFRRTFSTEFKVEEQQPDMLAAEVGTRGGVHGGGGWLKEYLSHSLSSSFRSSGRWFFTGSSRRDINVDIGGENGNNNNNRVNELDLEVSPLGDEIGELFRWLSGV